jgi:bifunctional non-homologous end joining protein LigD
MALERYRSKRSAERTPEPMGRGEPAAKPVRGRLYVVQKHSARRLHYDLRLEMEGVLRSWAVPKGPSLNPDDKRLAVMVEDHPLEYADFEGLIPEGNYGAGASIVWDRGRWEMVDPANGDAAAAVRDGKLDLALHGFKLNGAFTLVRTGRPLAREADGKQNWLLIKKRDGYATEDDVTELHPRSVLSGLTVEELQEAPAIGERIERELADAHAPRLKSAPEARHFPLNLAKVRDDPFDSDGWLFEIKYDGVRALAIRDGDRTRLFARSGGEITAAYPEIMLPLKAMPFERFVLDGEIVALGDDGRPSFQLLQRRMHERDSAQAGRLALAVPATYFVFDLLAFGAFDLRPLKLEMRKRFLARLVRGEGAVRYCEHVLKRGRDFFDAIAESGLEGIIAKRRDAPYRGTRTDDWLKIKCPRFGKFVIGGFTEPAGSRSHFGALLLGLWEKDGSLRFVGKVGTGFSDETLAKIHRTLAERTRPTSPFRPSAATEREIPKKVRFTEPDLVCEVRYAEFTDEGCLRHPSFQRMLADADPRECRWEDTDAAAKLGETPPAPSAPPRETRPAKSEAPVVKVTNAHKIFWPADGFTKGDLVAYYRAIARWMLPYLRDRPVMITRYPDGIEGESFYQKDAPGFAPKWMRREKIYSEDSHREISYFVLESEEALAYVANMGTIPIHVWSSHVPHLERPDWLLFDLDPKGSTTAKAAAVARHLLAMLTKLGLRPVVKTSGQAGFHVMVGLKPVYTYDQARSFSELVARMLVGELPELATIDRNVESRKGRVYIDYLQLGHGKTIAAPFSARPLPGAPASAPLVARELTEAIDVRAFNIKTLPARMKRLGRDPFIGVLEDQQSLESALPKLERKLKDSSLRG